MSQAGPIPGALGGACPVKTRSDLQWDAVLDAVAARCRGPMGKQAARALAFADSAAEVRSRLAEAREAHACLAQGEPLPVEFPDDVGEALERLRVGGVLAPAELKAMARMLGAARTLRRFMGRRRSVVPALLAACGTDPTLDELADEIGAAFDPDGTLSDRASPELGRLRSEQRAARTRILSRLEDLMNRYERVLQSGSSPSAKDATYCPSAPTRTSGSPASSTRRAPAARPSSWSPGPSSRWAIA